MTSVMAIEWLHFWNNILFYQLIEEQVYVTERHGKKEYWENPTKWAMDEIENLQEKCNGNFYGNH